MRPTVLSCLQSPPTGSKCKKKNLLNNAEYCCNNHNKNTHNPSLSNCNNIIKAAPRPRRIEMFQSGMQMIANLVPDRSPCRKHCKDGGGGTAEKASILMSTLHASFEVGYREWSQLCIRLLTFAYWVAVTRPVKKLATLQITKC